MAKLTLLIVAHQGGGKGSATTHIKKEFGAGSCRFSTPIRAVCDAAEIPQERAEMQKLAQVFRKAYGEDFWQKRMLKQCSESEADIMIIDGAREIGDITELIKDSSVMMMYLKVDKATRKARLLGRGENEGESEMTDEEFETAENHPNERAIEGMLEWVWSEHPDKLITIDNTMEWILVQGTISSWLIKLTEDNVEEEWSASDEFVTDLMLEVEPSEK